MSQQDGLVCAYLLDGAGGGELLDWEGVRAAADRDGLVWVHLDRQALGCRRWLAEDAGVAPIVRDALLAEESRPRCDALAGGLIVNLRGVNLNPGADPVDMVAVRMWIEPARIITVRGRHLMAIDDVRAEIEAGEGPCNPGDVVVALAGKLVARMSSVLATLDDELDQLEEATMSAHSRELRPQITRIRRRAIALRRYIAPEREALSRLMAEQVEWLDQGDREHLREVADRVTRYVEDLDLARERAAVIQDELSSRLAEKMDRTMYVLSMVAGIFLPLGLITGVLGVNLGGIPGEHTPWAFAVFFGLLLILSGGIVWLFRRLDWF